MYFESRHIARTKLDIVGGVLLYKGYHWNPLAAESAADWWIIKYTYSGTDIVDTQEQIGSYTNRAILAW